MAWNDVGPLPLAAARIKAHEVFDRIWQEEHMTRGEAYQWLAQQMGQVTHMGDADIETCKAVIKVVETHFGWGGFKHAK